MEVNGVARALLSPGSASRVTAWTAGATVSVLMSTFPLSDRNHDLPDRGRSRSPARPV